MNLTLPAVSRELRAASNAALPQRHTRQLSDNQWRLIELMQRLNFGVIEELRVQRGDPVFIPCPRVTRVVKIGADNGPRRETGLSDFDLKREVAELLQLMTNMENGAIARLEVRHGLPFLMEAAATNLI